MKPYQYLELLGGLIVVCFFLVKCVKSWSSLVLGARGEQTSQRLTR